MAQLLAALPQNFGGTANEGALNNGADRSGTNSTYANGVNLRGLGSDATLVLINGRRMAGTGSKGDFADVSSIPTAAIRRVDVLLDGASALYGADAVGGVGPISDGAAGLIAVNSTAIRETSSSSIRRQAAIFRPGPYRRVNQASAFSPTTSCPGRSISKTCAPASTSCRGRPGTAATPSGARASAIGSRSQPTPGTASATMKPTPFRSAPC